MSSCELVTLISTLACVINECCESEEIALLGVIFTQLGDTLLTIAEHESFCQSKLEKCKSEC